MTVLQANQLQQPIVASTDIVGDRSGEIVDLIVAGIDKNGANLEAAAKSIKDTLDKQYGLTWQVIIGHGFGFDVTCLQNTLMHCYYQGEIGVLVYKS